MFKRGSLRATSLRTSTPRLYWVVDGWSTMTLRGFGVRPSAARDPCGKVSYGKLFLNHRSAEPVRDRVVCWVWNVLFHIDGGGTSDARKLLIAGGILAIL